jgi:hypothetical protein
MIDNPLLGRWPTSKGPHYGALDTYALTVPWLTQQPGTLHDWGGGAGFARNYIVGDTTTYVNVDGTPPADAVDDLGSRSVPCDTLLLRHVLEMNPDHWELILRSALNCFGRRMAIVNFRPFADQTHVHNSEVAEGTQLLYLHFRKADIDEIVRPYQTGYCLIQTTHIEHIWYLEKR